MRADSVAGSIDELRARFATMAADQFHPNTEWRLTDSGTPKRVVVLVSRESHCLIDLLGRAERGEFPGEIAAVIGNHVSLGELTERFGVPFHLVPFDDPQVRRVPGRPVRRLGWASAPGRWQLAGRAMPGLQVGVQ